MSWSSDSKSVQGSKPVELYDFVTPTTTYRRTSFDRDVVFGGNTYTAIRMTRSTVGGTAEANPPEMTISIPTADAFVQAVAFGLPRDITVTFTVLQSVSGVGLTLWKGKITSLTVKGRTTEIRVPDEMDDALATSIPTAYHQQLCNHALGDKICRVDLTDVGRHVNTTVAGISGKTLTASALAGAADDFFKAGYVQRSTGGEYRRIVGQVGLVLTLSLPFYQLSIGDSINVVAGCDHLVKTCRDKFGNVLNFGGDPDIANKNPFSTGFRGIFT
jgi:hypothetical protein